MRWIPIIDVETGRIVRWLEVPEPTSTDLQCRDNKDFDEEDCEAAWDATATSALRTQIWPGSLFRSINLVGRASL